MKNFILKIKTPFSRVLQRMVFFSRKFSLPSVLIRTLFSRSKNTARFTSVLFGLPVYAILFFFLMSRHDLVTHDRLTIGLVFLAATWAWIGPVFIWRYEHITTTRYWAMCRNVVKIKSDLYQTRNMVGKTVKSSKGRLFLTAWFLLIVTAFVYSYDFMRGFGVISKTDVWWYMQVAGVAVYAYLTGIGFLLVTRTFILIGNFLPLNTKIDPYNPDERGGLGFFGKLLSETSLMFASGALYIPILMKLHIEQFTNHSRVILIIIGLYSAMIALSFVVPIWLIHKKILLEKLRKMTELSNSIAAIKSCTKEWGLEPYNEYRIRRDEYTDVSKIITWPFNLSNAVTVFSSIALPIILTAFQIALQK